MTAGVAIATGGRVDRTVRSAVATATTTGAAPIARTGVIAVAVGKTGRRVPAVRPAVTARVVTTRTVARAGTPSQAGTETTAVAMTAVAMTVRHTST